jgi:uncharacterized protein (DUF2384 family)
MATATAPPAEDFWARAPELFALASSIGERLERAEVDDAVAESVRRLADAMPQTPEPLGGMDPYLRSALLTAVIHAMRAEEDRDRRALRIAVERIRQALRDALDEHPVWRGGPKDAAVWLRELGLPLAEIADVLAASESSVRRWANPDDDTAPSAENADRVMAVAKIVNHLRHAMTARGALQWLRRPHPALDDRRPVEELKDSQAYRSLIHLASGTRSTVAT